MNQSDREHFDEIIVKAVQSGKQETSGLVAHILKELDVSNGKSVEKHINGHLRDIKQHLVDQDTNIKRIEKKIDDLKLETDPLVEGKKTLGSIKTFLLWVAPPTGIIYALWKFFLR